MLKKVLVSYYCLHILYRDALRLIIIFPPSCCCISGSSTIGSTAGNNGNKSGHTGGTGSNGNNFVGQVVGWLHWQCFYKESGS